MKKLLPFAALLAGALISIHAAPAAKPNIIFILVDDMGWGDVGVFHQNSRQASGDRSLPFELTPNLDHLAAEGARFTNHYVAAPVCASSRSSLLQGVTQGHANVRDNQFDKAIDENHTLGTVLRQAGYATAAIGKWGEQGVGGKAPDWPAHPLNRGFDYYYGYIRHVDGHEHYPKESIYFAEKAKEKGPVVVWENRTDVTAPLDKCYTADLWTARAKKWITEQAQADAKKPFFLYLAYDTPHAVLELPTQAYPAGGGLHGGMQWLGTPGHAITTASG
ncbi:MAG: arylsulfatase, partial [Lacunisphaera sp.]|nr:arylsulfatase [Lacunisphaera sp.]